MNQRINKTATSSSTTRSHLPCPQLEYSPDCYPFLDWDPYNRDESDYERVIIFHSLIATVKLQPTLDGRLVSKAVNLMASVHPTDRESADRFLDNFKQTADESLTDFVQSIVVLLSIPTHAITTAGMRMMDNLLFWCTVHVLRSLVEADLIPQLINTLHPQSLSFRETLDIHVHLMTIMSRTVWLATPYGLTQLGIADDYEPKTVHETILEQVLVPSEKYIWYLCVNRFLIIDGELCNEFMHLLAELLQISPYFQPMMDFLLHIPVFLTIPSYLTFVEAEQSNYSFLSLMTIAQQERNKKGGEMRQMGKTVDRMLRMEGIEDVIVEKLRNDTQKWHGGWIATLSIILSNMHGMNLPQWE